VTPGTPRTVARTDAGFTVVELAITMLLLTTVMTAIFGVLDSQTRTERRVQTFAQNQEVLRQAIVAVQRDIRSSETLKPLATSPEYALRIDLDVYNQITDENAVPIRWIVDPISKELRRELLDAEGDPTATTHRVTGVENSYAVPLFAFFNANASTGNQALGRYDLATDTAADVASCTVRIRIDLLAAPNPGPAPARVVSDAQLRNRLPGGAGCPVLGLAT